MCSVYTSVQSLLSNLLEHVWQQLQPLVFLSVMLQTRHACFWPVSHFHVSIFTKLQSVTTLTHKHLFLCIYMFILYSLDTLLVTDGQFTVKEGLSSRSKLIRGLFIRMKEC